MVIGKKGQAAAAAALIAVIAALIILYILFIPPEERQKILGDDNDTVRGVARASKNETLLNVSPGRIDFLSQKKIEHAIPNVHVFTRTAGLVLEEKDSIYVKRSVFSAVEADMNFKAEDLANTENLLLSFNVLKGKGRLIISLNGEEIFNKEVKSGNVEPISLKKGLLKAENVLNFKVSSPGIAFWRTNEYSLEAVQVTGDVTRTQAQRSRSVFLVSAIEFNNLERVNVKFQPDCDVDFVGPLDVFINQFNIYSAVPDCGVGRIGLEVPASYLKREENEIVFSIEKGDYEISHVAVESELKQIDFPVYFFEISEEQFNSVKNNTKRVIVKMDFVDDVEKKQGQLIVNGHTIGFDTKELILEEDISREIERGNNAVKIKPERTLDVRQVKVILAKRS